MSVDWKLGIVMESGGSVRRILLVDKVDETDKTNNEPLRVGKDGG